MSSSYLRRTVRGRLLALAIVVEALMLALMVANSLRLLQDAMTDQARWEAELIAPVIRAALVAPLAQHDFATVLAVINETQATQGIEYISVADRSGKLVASSGWPDDRKLPGPSTEFGRFNDDRSRFDVAAPIFQNSQRLGTLHFGLNLSHIVAARRHLLAQSVSIAIVELLLSSGILLLLGYWLTRHLTALTRASLEVAAGNLTPSPVPEGGDDFGRLGAAFNTMSRAIAHSGPCRRGWSRRIRQRATSPGDRRSRADRGSPSQKRGFRQEHSRQRRPGADRRRSGIYHRARQQGLLPDEKCAAGGDNRQAFIGDIEGALRFRA
jgi:HAMP domain-containing protein